MAGQPYALEVEGVSKRFFLRYDRPRSFQDIFVSAFRWGGEREEFWALRDVSFQVLWGEVVGIVGANGAGKSTLLKLIARIYTPTAGKIRAYGKVAGLLELGAGFHPELTGRENIYLYGSILGLNRRQMNQKLDEIVAFSELEHFLDLPVKHYSSGMTVRLGFAVASHLDASILLADEVIAVGDAAFQRKCLRRIRALRESGVTILLVSHDLRAVQELCQRVLWVRKGRIVEEGEARGVVKDYMATTGSDDASVPIRPSDPDGAIVAGVRLFGGDGEESTVFQTGETIQIEIDYRAGPLAPPAVFGVAVYRDDGVCCFGTNTKLGGLPPLRLDGQGRVLLRLEGCRLLEGAYVLDAAIVDGADQPLDYLKGGARFQIQGRSGVGLFQPEHTWLIPERVVE